MALCTRCGRQAEPGAEFCQGCVGSSAADAVDQPMTAPAMAAADYLRPFAAEGTSPALLRETQGPDYWTDPGIDRIPGYPEPVASGQSPSSEPPSGDEAFADDPSYPAPDDQPYEGPPDDAYNSGGGNVAPRRPEYLPAPGQAFTVGGQRYAPPGSPQGMLQPYGPADAPYAEGQERYPIPGAPYAGDRDLGTLAGPPYAPVQDRDTPAGPPPYAPVQDRDTPAGPPPYAPVQDRDTPAGPHFTFGPQRYPPAAEQYPAPADAYPAYPAGQRSAPAGGPVSEPGYYPAGQPYQASTGYLPPGAHWDATSPEDRTGLDPVRYPDPLLYPSTAAPTGPSDPAAAPVPADPGLSDPARAAGRGWGASTRRLLRRRAAAGPEPDYGEQWPAAGLPGQPYAAPHVPGGGVPGAGPALAMAATQADRGGPVWAGTGPADARLADAVDPMLAADSYADEGAEPDRFLTGRRPGQARWIAFAGAAIVLIIASAGAAIVLSHHSPPARTAGSGRAPASAGAPAPTPTTSPLVTVAPAAAGAAQAHAIEAFLTAYFTAINEHDFAAYRSLFSAGQRGGLSATAFARGYGSSQDSQATLRSIAVPAAGKVVATVSFVSHQQAADSATHSSCTSWTISLFLIKQAGTYVIHTPPASYGATAAACS
jgi:hypothetical protein